MPRGNKTGPMGMGPMTGRGAGLCKGNDSPGDVSADGGRMGCGFSGRRRGFRNMFYATGLPAWMRFNGDIVNSQVNDIPHLKAQAEYLNRSLNAVNKRLNEMETKDASE